MSFSLKKQGKKKGGGERGWEQRGGGAGGNRQCLKKKKKKKKGRELVELKRSNDPPKGGKRVLQHWRTGNVGFLGWDEPGGTLSKWDLSERKKKEGGKRCTFVRVTVCKGTGPR